MVATLGAALTAVGTAFIWARTSRLRVAAKAMKQEELLKANDVEMEATRRAPPSSCAKVAGIASVLSKTIMSNYLNLSNKPQFSKNRWMSTRWMYQKHLIGNPHRIHDRR